MKTRLRFLGAQETIPPDLLSEFRLDMCEYVVGIFFLWLWREEAEPKSESPEEVWEHAVRVPFAGRWTWSRS